MTRKYTTLKKYGSQSIKHHFVSLRIKYENVFEMINKAFPREVIVGFVCSEEVIFRLQGILV